MRWRKEPGFSGVDGLFWKTAVYSLQSWISVVNKYWLSWFLFHSVIPDWPQWYFINALPLQCSPTSPLSTSLLCHYQDSLYFNNFNIRPMKIPLCKFLHQSLRHHNPLPLLLIYARSIQECFSQKILKLIGCMLKPRGPQALTVICVLVKSITSTKGKNLEFVFLFWKSKLKSNIQ